jgi:lipoate-protein ligase A
MTTPWRLFRNLEAPVSTARGLAVDDTLPCAVGRHHSPPILHLYNFIPSAIVGKYQDMEAALRLDRCEARGIEYNRRSTGGGTVIMGPEIVSLGLGINVDYPGLKKGVGGVFESLSVVLINALGKLGVEAYFQPKNDLEVSGKKIAGLSAAAESDNTLLFHTSLLVNFDVELMTDIMNTPVVKFQDKGYNCFSQRMTTIRHETGREVSVKETMEAVQGAFEEEFRIVFQEDTPDSWEQNTIQNFIDERYTQQNWIFSHKHPRTRMGVGQLKTRGGLLEIYLSLSGASIESILITGDFFSTSADIHKIENALKWTSARRERIKRNIASVWHDDMIYGIDVPTLTQAVLLAKENQVRL